MPFRRATRADVESPQPEEPVRPGSKGRPTRTRREAEAARRRPLVPEDRQEAKRRSRGARNLERDRQQKAMMTGDTEHMPAQHRGPERAFVRDVVDSRHNVAEYFFPVAVVVMVLTFVVGLIAPRLGATAGSGLSLLILVVVWGGLIGCVLDSFLIRRRLRRDLTARFGGVGAGLVSYGIMRSISMRRLRIPKPRVKHGERPI